MTALGFPAITVVTTTSQSATNDGDDEGENTQTTSADVKPDVDASVGPKRDWRECRKGPVGEAKRASRRTLKGVTGNPEGREGECRLTPFSASRQALPNFRSGGCPDGK